MKKKLSVAFLWHMHQPIYQDAPNGTFYMPWARLHAVKDYLDMLYIMDKFKKLKLNFNLSPTVIDAFQKYEKGFDDIHSILLAKKVEELTDEDKLYVLNYFFDANYDNLIMCHPGYNKLYKKRTEVPDINIDDFSPQEYSDIIFWFNAAWMDPFWIESYPELKYLLEKDEGYTYEDRLALLNIQRDIISKIIPSYKQYQDDGKIEILTNPLYHPILPLLLDINVANNSTAHYGLPNCKFNFKDDAVSQVKSAIEMYEYLFDCKPKGMWPSELSVSDDTLKLFSECGIKWTVADESILSETLKKEFIRDNRGNLEDPYHLSNAYTYKNKKSNIGVFFRNSVFANLIGFEYPHYDSVQAANDLYDRIKQIQDKLNTSPDNNHIVVIAMDGENSWENYCDDGHKFLETLYGLICDDKTLETVTLSSYYENDSKNKVLDKIVPGSWINKNFQLWIAEPTKNKAWEYISKVRDDLLIMSKSIKDKKILESMMTELYVAEGSDWFWWFGEPNDSGQDNLFDYLFRKHLQNIYTFAGYPVPEFLKEPLFLLANRPSRYQKSLINPVITGNGESPEWNNAGCIDIPSGPLSDENQILNKICYGIGNDSLYLKMNLNFYTFNKLISNGNFYQIYIYIKNHSLQKSAKGKMRLVMRPEAVAPILKETFSHEIKITFSSIHTLPVDVAYSTKDGIWISKLNNNISLKLDSVLELQIPLADIDMNHDDAADFIVIDGTLGKGLGAYPRDMFLPLENNSKKHVLN